MQNILRYGVEYSIWFSLFKCNESKKCALCLTQCQKVVHEVGFV